MPSKPTEPKYVPVLTLGTEGAAVNGSFSGPDASGLLNDVPPMVESGIEYTPLVAITAAFPPRLGIEGKQSPKTHG